ncbi:hypothetical protein [Streptomyces sp. DG1A-41]|uniref:hypothetical protein n=1 Tax=Streptomyces sp. DG1A-41 TaxID=3125779 RepID=UPI0030D38784
MATTTSMSPAFSSGLSSSGRKKSMPSAGMKALREPEVMSTRGRSPLAYIQGSSGIWGLPAVQRMAWAGSAWAGRTLGGVMSTKSAASGIASRPYSFSSGRSSSVAPCQSTSVRS